MILWLKLVQQMGCWFFQWKTAMLTFLLLKSFFVSA